MIDIIITIIITVIIIYICKYIYESITYIKLSKKEYEKYSGFEVINEYDYIENILYTIIYYNLPGHNNYIKHLSNICNLPELDDDKLNSELDTKLTYCLNHFYVYHKNKVKFI